MEKFGLVMLWVRTNNRIFLKAIKKKYSLNSYSQAIDKLEELHK